MSATATTAEAPAPHWFPITFTSESVRAILAGRKTMTRRLLNEKTLRVRLPREVRSDMPFDSVAAGAGRHRAGMNQHGAVWVDLGGDDKHLGVRPGEFHFVCPYAHGDTHLGDHGAGRKIWTVRPERSMLWVRETWAGGGNGEPSGTDYKADQHSYGTDGDGEEIKVPWRSPRFMPRALSRISLVVIEVRAERLQWITDDDAVREGAQRFDEIPSEHPYPSCANRWSMGDPRSTDECLGSPRSAFANAWNVLHGGRNWNMRPEPEQPWNLNPWVWTISFSLAEVKS